MAKDYAKFVPPKKRASPSKRNAFGVVFVVFLLIVVSLGAGIFVYQKTASPQTTNEIMAKLSALFAHKKSSPALAKATTVASHEQPPPVQFDFYNQLPNPTLQTSLPDTVGAENSQPIKPSNTPVIAINTASTPREKKIEPEAVTATPEASTQHSAEAEPTAEVAALKEPTPSIAPAPKPAEESPKPAIFNPEEVSNLLAAEVSSTAQASQQQYEVHIGTFESEQGARLLLQALEGVGFQAEIIKINQGGRRAYRVQQGPYESLSMAKSTQQRLQKRGIISVIRKT